MAYPRKNLAGAVLFRGSGRWIFCDEHRAAQDEKMVFSRSEFNRSGLAGWIVGVFADGVIA